MLFIRFVHISIIFPGGDTTVSLIVFLMVVIPWKYNNVYLLKVC